MRQRAKPSSAIHDARPHLVVKPREAQARTARRRIARRSLPAALRVVDLERKRLRLRHPDALCDQAHQVAAADVTRQVTEQPLDKPQHPGPARHAERKAPAG